VGSLQHKTCIDLKLIIMLLIDNAPTHMLADAEVQQEHGFNVINLSHLKIVFLPANTTIVVQPLPDQGTIACTKAHYQRQLVQWVLDEADKPQNDGKSLKGLRPNFYQMMRWLNTAWKECVMPLTISNCWYKDGILPEGWISVPTGTSWERARAAQRALASEEAAQPAMHPASMSVPHQAAAEAADESEEASREAAQLPNTEAGSPADSADGQDDALEQLDAAPQRLQVCVQRNKLLLQHGDAMMSAKEFHELDGDCEVFEELDDDAIVLMIRSNNAANASNSDEDEGNYFVEVSATKTQALQLAASLHEYVLARAQLSAASDVSALQRMQDALAQSITSGKKQTTLTATFGMP
jgi:hypothetical protein